MKTFKELGLSESFSSNLEKMKIVVPTEIQEQAIPFLMKGEDVIGGSATGSGKTLAFGAPIIENLKPGEYVQALIMTPTRELAEQVAESIEKFASKKLKILPVYGGTNIERQIRMIPHSDVIVGTPGRILDHLQRRTLRLDHVKFLVLDEVDRMFDMGFRNDVERIIRECPEERQTMLFSATLSADMDYLAHKYTNNPKEVVVESYVDTSKLKQTYYDVDSRDKFSLLTHFLKEEGSRLTIVFCNTRRNVDFLVNHLEDHKVLAGAIHGGMVQKKRLAVLKQFQDKEITTLICTDVAARGLDIKGVSHVYNYDLPPTKDEYIHRIGRTARAGEEGIAINILSNRDYENFGNILQDKTVKIDKAEAPRFQILRLRKLEIQRRGGNFNRSSPSRGRDSSRGRPGNSRGPQRGRSNVGRGPNRGRGNSSGNARSYGTNGGRAGNNRRSNSSPRHSRR
ncbi:DEAD/DEAH box helicase [archaeon]|jgi:ATP-dependent RNA helicase DeaD|nr:DEAD/DEAH box helicase [archaeon]